ncbi:MAG: hypothetical protein JKX70_10220 [Phycisphaerales bacterium]|nr:hypothetical protein [Phycisphaerales bacterium]
MILMKTMTIDKVLLRISITLIASLWLSTSGCMSSRQSQISDSVSGNTTRIELQAANYEEVFSAAREVLAKYRFGINRIDASRGVITSFPKRTAGLASPWDREQSTLGQELEDLANQQERTVRIEFVRSADTEPGDSKPALSSSQSTIDVIAMVEVVVSRVHRPHWRVESESVRLSTHARSRNAAGQIEPGSFREPIGQDKALAERIAHEIARRFE